MTFLGSFLETFSALGRGSKNPPFPVSPQTYVLEVDVCPNREVPLSERGWNEIWRLLRLTRLVGPGIEYYHRWHLHSDRDRLPGARNFRFISIFAAVFRDFIPSARRCSSAYLIRLASVLGLKQVRGFIAFARKTNRKLFFRVKRSVYSYDLLNEYFLISAVMKSIYIHYNKYVESKMLYNKKKDL